MAQKATKKQARQHSADAIYVQAAFFCESVSIEENSILSFHRLITTINVEATSGRAPDTMPPVTISPNIVLAITSDVITGTYDIALSPVRPDGLRLGSARLPVDMASPGIVKPTFTQVTLPIEMEGTYWFDLMWQEKLVTRIPLTVTYQAPKQTTIALDGETDDSQR